MDVATQIQQLQQSDVEQQLHAAEALCAMGEEASPAALTLIDLLASEDERLCEAATAALESCGPPPAAMTGDLAMRLTADNASCAFWAATLLGRQENQAANAANSLASVVADSAAPSEVRQKAAWALSKIGPAARPILPALANVDSASDARLARLIKSAISSIES